MGFAVKSDSDQDCWLTKVTKEEGKLASRCKRAGKERASG